MSDESPYITHRQALAGIPAAVTIGALILSAVGQCSVQRANAAAERAEGAASAVAEQVRAQNQADTAATHERIKESEGRLAEQLKAYRQEVTDLTKMLLRGEVRPAGGRR